MNRTMGDKCAEHLTVLQADDYGYRLVPCDSRCPENKDGERWKQSEPSKT